MGGGLPITQLQDLEEKQEGERDRSHSELDLCDVEVEDDERERHLEHHEEHDDGISQFPKNVLVPEENLRKEVKEVQPHDGHL